MDEPEIECLWTSSSTEELGRESLQTSWEGSIYGLAGKGVSIKQLGRECL